MTKQKATTNPGKKKRKAPPPSAAAPKTKLGQLEGMLRRNEGATIAQIATALDWQPHTVRGAISGSLKKLGTWGVSLESDAICGTMEASPEGQSEHHPPMRRLSGLFGSVLTESNCLQPSTL